MNNPDHIHHRNGATIYPIDWGVLQILLGLLLLLVIAMYIVAVIISNRRYKQWPYSRTLFWVLGVFFAAFAMIGPFADRAHIDFNAHMLGHLLLGMLAPLFMVLATPMTLLLRTLPVILARRLSRTLKSWFVRTLTDPTVGSLLNVGALWILYCTDLFKVMHQNIFVHILVHLHVFIAGFIFTMSIISIDLTSHRTSYLYRTIVLLIALAAHSILSKYIYAYPPNGVPAAQAEMGGKLMYYGGDAIDFVLIYILFYQWFRATRSRTSLSKDDRNIKVITLTD
jgi:putative membrane protein